MFYAQGKVWSTQGNGVSIGGQTNAGVRWLVINPHAGRVEKQGDIATADIHLTHPSIAVTTNGQAAITFTMTGSNFYPGAGYVTLGLGTGPSDVHTIIEGAGPYDSFLEYFPPIAWGDYSAAVTDGSLIWFGSEMIRQSCADAQFNVDPTCGGTRDPFTNWGTRITTLSP